MPYRQLGNTGLKVSVLSFGASSLGSVFRTTDDEESANVVKTAVQSGINYIDTAPWYGHGKSETVLGKILPSIPRSSYYIATKVGRYLPQADKMFDFSAERTIQSVDESLQRLGLDYVDILQVHDMEFAPSLDIILNETLPAMQKIKDAGKAKFIGITGYPLDNFKTVIEGSSVKIDTILTYCRGSMNDNSLKDWLPYFKERDVDISRLGLRFTLEQEEIPTTLVSTASLANLQKNLDSVYTALTEKESQVLEEVMEKFMKPLNNANWEGVEVADYKKQLQDLQSGHVETK